MAYFACVRCRLYAAISSDSATAITAAVGQETLLLQTYGIQLPPAHNRDANVIPGTRDMHATALLQAVQPSLLNDHNTIER